MSARHGIDPAPRDWTALSADQADREAWRAVCEWPKYAAGRPVTDGVDYALLSRWHLRHRVGRAIRRHREPSSFNLERQLLTLQDSSPDVDRASGDFRGAIRQWRRRLKRSLALRRRAIRPVYFVPLPHARWVRTAEAVRHCGFVSASGRTRPDAGRQRLSAACSEFADGLVDQICLGLDAFNVRLLEEDKLELRRDLAVCRANVNLAMEELTRVGSRLLLTFSDNDPPNMEFVLLSRRDGRATVMLQHGLDCENLALDDAYADFLLLWGSARKSRYSRDSERQPKQMAVVGDPELDGFGLPSEVSTDGEYWVWVTRPHTPEKCYLPSRRVTEGLEILDALIGVLRRRSGQRLLIKAHPFDYVELYRQRIEAAGMGRQVALSDLPVQQLIPGAGLVFSEDSTAGMEALLFGKPLIHTHFAPVAASLPFVEFRAAFPAWDAGMLADSTRRIEAGLTPSDRRSLLDGQREFLLDHAGPCDGLAGKRLAEQLREIAARTVMEGAP